MSEFAPKAPLPLGKRFTDVYRERGRPSADNERMRRRIASTLAQYGDPFEKYAERQLGIQTPYSLSASWSKVVLTWDLEDVLNVITVLVNYLQATSHSQAQKTVVARTLALEFNRIFEQENVSYRVDAQGGVHFLHDEEFTRSTQATIEGLSASRYVNSLDRFESGIKAISAAIPDGKTGIRNVFKATEGLFRLLIPRAPRLAADQVNLLDPILQKRYAGDGTATGAAGKLLASFKDWIESCHFYRHEPGKPDQIAQPPIELAIHLLSVGAAFIRLLVEIDGSSQESAAD